MEALTHEQELKEIFDQLPEAKLYGDTECQVRLINYSLLETIVSKMMNKAYYYGRSEGIDAADAAIAQAFGK